MSLISRLRSCFCCDTSTDQVRPFQPSDIDDRVARAAQVLPPSATAVQMARAPDQMTRVGELSPVNTSAGVSPLSPKTLTTDSGSEPAGLITSLSNESLLGRPPTIKRQFSKPLNQCIILLDALKSSQNASQQAYLVGEILKQNGIMQKLVSDILRHEEAADLAAAAQPTDSGISIGRLVHELRAPLQGVLSTIELYQLDGAGIDLKELSKRLNNYYTYLQTLVENLPKLPVGTRQKLTLHSEAFTLERLQKTLENLTGDSAKKKRISIKYDFPSLLNGKGLAQEFNGDFTKLVQIILNFANNAIKHGNEGGNIVISVRIEKGPSAPDALFKFSVNDDGPGMSQELQARLFGAFVRGEKKDPAIESSGVGLYLCKLFIELLNYDAKGPDARPTLWVKSAPGQGSEFSFTAIAQEIPDFVAPAAAVRRVEPKETFNGKPVILCADDTPISLDLMTRMLIRAGCIEENSRVMVLNGAEAVQRCDFQQFDVVFLDDQMPVMGGTDAARAIFENAERKNKTPPHIIMMTGNPYDEVYAKLNMPPHHLGRFVIKTEETPEDDVRMHIAQSGPGPRILILSKPVRYVTIVRTVNALTEES